MADSKITALTALTAADPVNDMFPVVDVSDTTMAASGTTKKISVNNILGASGTATLASATITGAATVGTTLGVTGVSTFAAGTALLPALTTTGDTNTGIYYPAADAVGVTAGGAEVTRVTSTGLGIGVTPNTPLAITHSDTVSTLYPMITAQYVTGTYAGMYAVRDGAGDQRGIAWQTYKAGTGLIESLRLSSDGNLSLANGNVVMTTSGKGIDFSATSSGSGTMTSELLNDYEEGTWVPTQGAGLTVVGTFSSSGTYTKVGRLVTITGILNGSTSIATAAAGLMCSGLPFSASQQAVGGGVNQFTNTSADCVVNNTDIYSITAIGATTAIRFSATYTV